MSVERWERTKQLLEEAVGLSREKRRAYLDSACGQDDEMRVEVESLIAAHEEAGSQFLAAPAAEIHDLTSSVLVHLPTLNQMIGHYRVVEEIGRGGMGVVYQAEDLNLGRYVAMKFLPGGLASDRASLERLQREARAASALDHPNICSIYELGEHEGQPFIAMQLLEGQTLREWIENAPKLDMRSRLSRVLDLAIQIADGLDAAHRKGIVHRDIKPANIFITTRGDAKILDFGLAKVVDSQPVPDVQSASGIVDAGAGTADAGKPHLTRTGTTAGTPCYMSPEQVRREQLDARTDLFSLGLVLYETVAGQRAFAGETWTAVQESILQRPPTPVRQMNPTVPAELERIINKALEKDRAQRYQSAQDALRDLLQLREAFGPAISVRKRKLLQVAAALLFAIGATAGGLYYHGHRSKLLINKDAIVIADLTNTTGDPVFDGTLRQALAVKLEESPFLNVVSDQKMNTMLGLTGHPPPTTVTPEIAREICIRSGDRVMVTGSIAHLGSQFLLTLQSVDCATGNTLAGAEREAAGKDQVPAALGSAAAELRRKLGESRSTLQRFNKPLEEATTSSMEALQAYTLGWKALLRNGPAEAVPFLNRAIELDPDFAMAHSALGEAYIDLEELGLGAASLKRAFELRDRVSAREGFYITANYKNIGTGKLEEARTAYELWIEAYPQDAVAHADLGDLYASMGRYDKAIQETREAIRLDQDLSYAYANLMAFYVATNSPSEAKKVYAAAQGQKLDIPYFHLSLYQIEFLENDSAGMAREIDWAQQNPGERDEVLSLEANTEAHYGRLRRSVAASRLAVQSAQLAGKEEAAALWLASAALQQALLGGSQGARQSATAALKAASTRDVEATAAMAFARTGDASRARTVVDDLRHRFPEDTFVISVYIPAIEAQLELTRGKAVHANEILRGLGPYELAQPTPASGFIILIMYPVFICGEAYLSAEQTSAAVVEFRKILDHRGLVANSPIGALAHLGLARAYALQADTAKARAAYQDFLTLWKDADSDIPILKQAKAEYAKLR